MYSKGLKGIVAAETKLSFIDGANGILTYRGIPIEQLATKYTFEAVAYFLWHGSFPDTAQLNHLRKDMKKYRILPDHVKQIIQTLPKEMDLMSVLRTALSSIYIEESNPSLDHAIRITAIIPTIIASRYRFQRGLTVLEPHSEYGHVKNFLYMLKGAEPLEDHITALETYMILTMEHSMNASTFSARVTISTESDMISAITSAIGTMKGPLHGGAPSGVINLLNEISDNLKPVEVIRTKIEHGERLMGFGHRVYKTRDPRSIALKTKLLEMNSDDPWLRLALQVEEIAVELLEAYKPGRNLKTNVEFYAAAIMKAIELDTELFTPTFSAARAVGWTAHVLEQIQNNTIYRPEALFIKS
ncbi:citrate/2-methylcitrate synthase [Salirhabdus sp. Marseille-P4669]|uniref:citrate/2-methylcitrate synthase n=1 Tax=Salirhabdus sp. Marseille-P4669 TaxID=2042310 RepID=UPI000C7D0B52|nr:citrate/2-methylcitrate synthase [Salirhabdus sp. Marseille-P4669]